MYIKLCSYNFMLKEAPNNNDSTCIANNELNEAPNKNGATGVANNMRLATIGAKQFLMAIVYPIIIQKSQLTRDER